MLTRKMIVGMIMVILVSLSATTWAVVGLDEPEQMPQYTPGEIIIKFDKSVADSLAEQLARGVNVGTLRLSPSLDNLNSKYKVRNIEAIFKNFYAERKRIEELPKKDPALLTPREKHIVRRLRRAPKDAKVPDLGRIYKLELEREPEEWELLKQVVAEYDKEPDVEYAELNWRVSICSTEPNDSAYSVQWPLANTGQDYPWDGRFKEPPGTPDCDIDANEAWDIRTGSSDIIVAVIDTGVDYTHRDLGYKMWTDANGYYGYDFCNDDNDPMDDHGHGTHCAGIIAADSNNGCDIAGVSWDAKIMALKFLNRYGSGLPVDAADAIYYAANNGADVISNSWGGSGPSDLLEDAIDYAHDSGVVQVAAAGNDNSNSPFYPAYYDHMISVAATDSNDDRASFSNYGDWVDIAAPGVDILSLRGFGTSMGAAQGDYLTVASGTSMACPHVAGACALLLSIDPVTLGPNDVNEILMETVDVIFDPNDHICASNGRLNLYKAALESIPSKGHIDLDRDYYNCDDTISIFLADSHLADQNNVDVNITTSGSDPEIVSLTEIGLDIGVFTGEISTESNDPCAGDGVLQVSHGETITVTYEDANDGSGNPASPNDTATVDCVCPVISNLDFSEAPIGPEPVVTFDTNEISVGRALYSLTCGGPYSSSTLSLGVNHTVKLKGVSPWTDYYFIVEATDLAGNKTTDTNDSNCYTFTTDGPSDINVPEDYNSIQNAIDSSSYWPGSRVIVAPGTYYEFIDFKGKVVTVTGTKPYNWETVEATVIDANMKPGLAVVSFRSGEDRDSVLRGLTIRNSAGHGVFCTGYGGPVVSNCIVENCAEYGLVSINSNSPVFSNNKVRNNKKGILLAAGPAYVENNWVHDNNDFGIRVVLGTGQIANCTVVDNSVGISVALALPSVTNCIVWGNDVNDIEGSNILTYSCISDCNELGDPNKHNICCDPCFVDIDANDFHLDANSMCIDAGDPNGDYAGQTDIDGNCRDVNGVDIGADEVCVPTTYSTYADWLTLGKPDCWCYCYQCDGDADGSTEDPNNYRIYDGDMALITANWKKKIDDPTLDPCADIDHKDSGMPFKYRVYTNDLGIVTTNWKKKDGDLPGDCPRSE